MDGRADMVGVVTLPMASGSVPRYGVLCCGVGIWCSPFWGVDFGVIFSVAVRVTRGGALIRLRRRGAER